MIQYVASHNYDHKLESQQLDYRVDKLVLYLKSQIYTAIITSALPRCSTSCPGTAHTGPESRMKPGGGSCRRERDEIREHISYSQHYG